MSSHAWEWWDPPSFGGLEDPPGLRLLEKAGIMKLKNACIMSMNKRKKIVAGYLFRGLFSQKIVNL